MELFTLTLHKLEEGHAALLRDLLEAELSGLHTILHPVSMTIQEGGKPLSIRCESEDIRVTMRAASVYEKASRAIAEFMLTVLERPLLRRLIVRGKGYADDELGKIEAYCIKLLNQPEEWPEEWAEERAGERAPSPFERRKEKLAGEIAAYLELHATLNVEGFYRFRLAEYVEQLREVVEYAVDEYLMEKQYQEFVGLLKYFVYIQEAKIPAAHLIHRGDHRFTLLDEQMEPIAVHQLEQTVIEMLDKDLHDEDMIVSTLITISPKNVYIHTRQQEAPIIQTIRQIFDERAFVCSSCASCSPYFGERPQVDKIYT